MIIPASNNGHHDVTESNLQFHYVLEYISKDVTLAT